MPKIVNDIRITKCGKARMKQLKDNPHVERYHQNMFKNWSETKPKNFHHADVEIFQMLSDDYKNIPMPKECK